MTENSDRELLTTFSREGDEGAFAELVRRYAGLVLGAALRRTGDHGMAEEVTQNVFTILARKAPALVAHPALAAWLQKTAAYESARAAEKEHHRQRTMNAYERQQSMDRMNTEASWQTALPHLDDAVAALPELDRQVLLLRYWQSAPFKNIAAALGSTVAACEKRIERALQKLSRALRRRGVFLGATALGAGLTPALTKAAASPALLARLVPAVLTGAKAAPPAAGWITFLLMKSKLSLTIAALVVLAVCGGAGWLAGRAQATAQARTPHTSPDQSSHGAASASVAGGTSPGATRSSRRQQLRALLEAVQRDLLTADFDPLAKARAAARVAAIAPADMRAALELAATLPGGMRNQQALTGLLLQHWAQSDGPAACEYAITKVPPPHMGLPPVSDPLKVWAARDPRAALAWFREHAAKKEQTVETSGRWMPISSIRWIMGAWSLQDMPAAMEAFLALTDKQEISGAVTGFTEMSGAAPERTPILDAYLKLHKEAHEGNALMEIGRLLDRWSAERASEFAPWLDRQNVPKSYHGSLGKSILKGWLREDPAAAIQWWLNAPGGYPERAGRTEDIVSAWTESDVFAAAEWLATQPLDQSNARAMTTLAGKVAASDPERGWQWAMHIPQDHYRKDALRQVTEAWAHRDRDAAVQAVQSAPLDDALKAELLKSLTPTAQ